MLTLLASRQGSLENGCEKEESAERYDRSEVVRMDGERRAAAMALTPGTLQDRRHIYLWHKWVKWVIICHSQK